MHYRMASAAVAFSLMAAPLAADIPKPVVGKVPAADISDDQALGCMYRLVVLRNRLADRLKRSDLTAKDRETATSLKEEASGGVTFYAALLYSRPWFANRQGQMVDQVVAQGKETADTNSNMAISCLERSLQARSAVIDVAIGK